MDYTPESIMGAIGASVTALITGGLWLRRKVRSDGVDSSGTDSVKLSIEANSAVITTMRAELERISRQVEELEKRVDQLTDKLANVRLIALDCIQLANECECQSDNRKRLLEHLKQIVRDS